MGNGFNDADRLGNNGWKGGALAILGTAPGTTNKQKAALELLRVRNDVSNTSIALPSSPPPFTLPSLSLLGLCVLLLRCARPLSLARAHPLSGAELPASSPHLVESSESHIIFLLPAPPYYRLVPSASFTPSLWPAFSGRFIRWRPPPTSLVTPILATHNVVPAGMHSCRVLHVYVRTCGGLT
jgi:hypothetical protein